jgi:hypothetical protein
MLPPSSNSKKQNSNPSPKSRGEASCGKSQSRLSSSTPTSANSEEAVFSSAIAHPVENKNMCVPGGKDVENTPSFHQAQLRSIMTKIMTIDAHTRKMTLTKRFVHDCESAATVLPLPLEPFLPIAKTKIKLYHTLFFAILQISILQFSNSFFTLPVSTSQKGLPRFDRYTL